VWEKGRKKKKTHSFITIVQFDTGAYVFLKWKRITGYILFGINTIKIICLILFIPSERGSNSLRTRVVDYGPFSSIVPLHKEEFLMSPLGY
jgi:hypothetical protein